ncbi:alpha/beta hydrolase fold domain-containing protein [Prosthecobacter sp.]|uniref:alpha/beta hydrolase fold domain-containing protein n=1 Tax=Prosthecobacter sp. TaxID=1965333 RepID=UPI0037843466
MTPCPPQPPTLPPHSRTPIASRLHHLTSLGLLLLFLLASCTPYGPARPNEKIYRSLVFSSPGGHDLRMDLYVPRSDKPVPVVMWMFGGGWAFGSKRYHINIRDLTSGGIAVASIQYRLSGTAPYPAQLDDCRAAFQWLRKNGPRYGLDPNRIGAAGESAGGHLAALLASKEGKSRVRAVCALYSPSDLVELGWLYEKRKKINLIEKFLGGRMSEKTDLAATASPINYATAMPPVLLIHGTHDHVVPVEQSERFFEALGAAGVEVQLIEVPGKLHWFRLDDAQLAEVFSFFHRHLSSKTP